MKYIITLISALSVQELFIDGDTNLKQQKDNQQSNPHFKIKFSQLRQAWAGIGELLALGDFTVLLVALGAVEYEENNGAKFCEQNGIRLKAVLEAKKLRKQLTDTGLYFNNFCFFENIQVHIYLVNAIFPQLNLILDPKMAPPTHEQAKLLRQIVLSGMVDRIAK